jgi:thiol-disulfide isomerase/thioredoxin/sugar lactone lactonase YvrE
MRILLLALLIVLASAGCDRKALTAGGTAESSATSTTLPPPNLRPRGGDFTGATAWLNAERPLVPADLAGRVVVVDFWTSCCINCLHTLPILSALEKRHEADAVLVVGVHSPKFDAETEGERLRSAIVENSITHPVAVDGSMKIWTAWQAQSWPTVFVLDAKGRIVWRGSGEPNKDVLEAQVAAALDEGRREGILKTEKLAAVKPLATDTGPLAFPGKIIALDGGAFAVSDTGHHRIVVFDATFAVKEVIGTGLAGMTDGGYAEASFRKPQGLAVSGDLLYVADTENHAIRVVDRKARTVKTVAGTGEIAHRQLDERSKARETALRSPWDLVVVKDIVYVALAGSHMIAAFDPKAGTIERWAGDGVERRYDNTGAEASFAQPSGITSDGTTLWVADSETSSIRAVTIATREVKTLVGKDLFVFGDVDGAPDLARLEHPLGVAVLGRALFIADTYNSKIKRLDLATSSVRTLVGARDHKDLFEPSGLVARAAGAAGKDIELIVVDTKHHRLARVVVSAGGDAKVEPIAIRGLNAPASGIAVANADDSGPPPPSVKIEASDVAVRSAGTTVHLTWDAPKGTGVNEEAPFKVRWKKSEGLSETPADTKTTGATVKKSFDVTVRPASGAARARLEGELDMVVCDVETHAVCVPVRRALVLGFAVTKDGAAETVLNVKLPEAKASK